jgi:hypothetical protein
MTTSPRPFLDQSEKAVYLTLIAHADERGLVTACTLTDLHDYAALHHIAAIQETLARLEHRRLLSIRRVSTKKTHYLLLGDEWRRLLDEASAFEQRRRPHVNAARNARAAARIANVTQPHIAIHNLTKLPYEEGMRHRWRFSLRLASFGWIYDCLYSTREPSERGYVYGPTRKNIASHDGNTKWLRLVEFEPEVSDYLRSLLHEATTKD